ncbi:MAG TPA: metallophosphoesterase [Actinomycetota bacterium]|jgi:hypothetical protein|nr:metallophosphoesterase [Actinomycetota bacterium]
MRRHVYECALAIALLMLAALTPPAVQAAAAICGASGTHTICVTMPGTPDSTGTYMLSGDARVTVTVKPNSGRLFFTWAPSTAPSMVLMEDFRPSALDGGADYSFTWPTARYYDARGSLLIQAGDTTTAAVTVPVSLVNGNTTTLPKNRADWTTPAPWTSQTADPVVPAVGDGASDEPGSQAVSDQIAAARPPLFLYLGDVYETGTDTEMLNHYGVSDIDGVPGSGTEWGRFADVTQPTIGNHEFPNQTTWRDYFHQRPLYTAYRFGGVQFLDLNSNVSMQPTSTEYIWAQSILSAVDRPACVVAYFHHPVLYGTKISTKVQPMWNLLANNGGDLLLVGHRHAMAAYGPLTASLTQGAGAHMYELVSGAGGHEVGAQPVGDARQIFARGGTPGAVWLTLNGARANSSGTPGVATSISWQYETTAGSTLSAGTVTC